MTAALIDAKPGGWSVPSVQLYEFCPVPPVPMELPDITIKRGGVRYFWNGRYQTPRWTARTRWGRRIKRVLFGVQWADAPFPRGSWQVRWPVTFVFSFAD